jgi:photosystem II stability/assembly factor-like uncharacterized protein
MQARRLVAVGALVAVGVLAATLSAFAAPVSVGHSGWTWGDPVPQGETLNNVVFSGARGFAVGELGTVLRSEDGGATWTGLPSGTTSILTLAQAVDANTVVVGGECTVRESVNAGASFQRLPVNESEGTCATKIASFSFLNPSTGFVEEANGAVLLTSDGGQTLQAKTPVPLNGGTAARLDFVSPTTGFAVTGGAPGGRIFRTTDGANSWTQVGSSPAPLSDLTFVTSTTAFAVGANNTLLQSTDEGATWKSLALALPSGTAPQPLTHISCSDVKHCLIATAPAGGGNTNVLVRTTDGGLTGSLVSASQQNLLAVSFSTASNAVAVGQGGATVLSSNGGETFPTLISHRLGVDVSHGFPRIGQTAMDAYIPGSAGQIAATTNGGESWGVMRVPTSQEIFDVGFPTTEIGYAINKGGTVYRTANGGVTWSILNAGASAKSSLVTTSPSSVLLIGPKGVRRSTNSGASFAAVGGKVALPRKHGKPRSVSLSSIDLTGGGETVPIVGGSKVVTAAGQDGLFESTNGGASWKLIPPPKPGMFGQALSFVSATTGYAFFNSGLYFTHDGGRHWKQIQSVGSAGISAIDFSSASDGYMVIGSGVPSSLLRTEDGGRTWAPEVLPNAKIAGLTAAGPVDYAVGAGAAGGIFQTTTGGMIVNRSTLKLALRGSTKMSRAKLKRAGHKVSLSGRLTPASGGETVIVSYSTNGTSWRHKSVTVSSSGTFTVTITGISSTTNFVAQWRGNDVVSGAGTPATKFTVTK